MVTTVRAPAGRGERGDGRRRDEGEVAAAGGRAAGGGDGDRPVAPLPTVAVMVVALTTVKDGRRAAEGHRGGAGEIRPGDGHHRPRCPPLVGVNEVMVGAGMKVKVGGAGRRAAGSGDADRAGGAVPYRRGDGGALSTVKVAAVPPKVTAVRREIRPLMVTNAPLLRWSG